MPDPKIDYVFPPFVEVGYTGTLSVIGSEFVEGDYVFLNGRVLPTRFVSKNELIAEIEKVHTAEPEKHEVKVHGGSGGLSNVVFFTVEAATTPRMKDHYNPFEDCMTFAKTAEEKRRLARISEPYTRWIAQAVQMVVAVAYAYDTIVNKGSNVVDLVDAVQQELTEIRRKLDDLNRNVERLIDALDRLPEIVRGEVENALIRENLGEADAITGLIKDKMRPQFIDSNLDEIEVHCEQLQVKLGAIKGLRGLAGVVISAPYISTWLSATTTVQKKRLSLDPDHLVNSPWSRSFMNDNLAMMRDFIRSAENEDKRLENVVIPSMPPHGRFFITKTKEFKSNPFGSHRLTCPFGLGGELFQSNKGFGWQNVTEDSDPENYTLWTSKKKERDGAVDFYDVVPEFYNERARVLGIFLEPKDFWEA